MAETGTVNQEATNERTFTQTELNDIIQARLGKERDKYADYEALKEKAQKFDKMEEASKSELQKATDKAKALQAKIDEMNKAAEVTAIRNKIASETGVPVNLLTGETEEACKVQAEGILAFAKPNAYPMVKDGGEAIAPTANKSNAEKFADWFSASLNNN